VSPISRQEFSRERLENFGRLDTAVGLNDVYAARHGFSRRPEVKHAAKTFSRIPEFRRNNNNNNNEVYSP